jgi:hypothetical protein
MIPSIKFPVLVIAGLVWICGVVLLIDRISGGKITERQVSQAVRTNQFIRDYLGEPITELILKDTPSGGSLYPDGTRIGYYWFRLGGARTRGEFKIEWKLPPRQEPRLVRIFLRDTSGREKLLWELKRETSPDVKGN